MARRLTVKRISNNEIRKTKFEIRNIHSQTIAQRFAMARRQTVKPLANNEIRNSKKRNSKFESHTVRRLHKGLRWQGVRLLNEPRIKIPIPN